MKTLYTTMGGDLLEILYDTQEQKYVLALDSYLRDGVYASDATLIVYGSDLAVREYELQEKYVDTATDLYADVANQIRAETDLYTEDEQSLVCYKINGAYAPGEEYLALRDRFAPGEDHGVVMINATVDDPLALQAMG